MRRSGNLRIWALGVLLCLCFSGYGQRVYYVAPGGNDSNTGAADNPFKTVYKALEAAKAKASVDTIRIAVGKYAISSEAGPGELDIPAGLTVHGGFKVQADGVVLNERAVNVDQEERQTILQGDSSCRIVYVAGTLEGVTIAGGMASQRNGGGVYVEDGGMVRNCIIHSNRATGLVPKVGDLLMEDGSFMLAAEFRADMIDKLEGVVFWINPLKNAPAGQQGKAVNIANDIVGAWVHKSGNPTATFTSTDQNTISSKLTSIQMSTVEMALEDLDGEAHTDLFFASAGSQYVFELADLCRDLGSLWYMPASGELMLMLVEWAAVSNSQKAVWDALSAADRVKYFKVSSSSASKDWYNASMAWNGVTPIASSSFRGSTYTLGYWELSSFKNDTEMKEQTPFAGTRPNRGLGTFAVRKF